jgi:hypothetical protein
MSFFFKKNNEETTRDLYLKKLIYDATIREPGYDNLINFYVGERYLYGRVNELYIPIELDTTSTPLAGLNTTNTEQTGMEAVAFVVAAFNALNEQFNKKLLSGEIPTNDPYLSRLEVKKAYENPRTLYSQYVTDVISAMHATALEQKVRFHNFDQFMTFFEGFAFKMSKSMPITYTAFVKSKYCPMNASGLVIEIADQEYFNDEEKIANFKQSPVWEFYLNACRSYGFWVDSSNPFRLIANIGSPEMLEYARTTTRCRFTSTYDILNNGYTPANNQALENLKEFMYRAYNMIKKPYIDVEMCGNGSTISKKIIPEEFTFEQFNLKYNDTYFIKRYVAFRLNEEKKEYTQEENLRIVKDTVSVAGVKSVPDALRALEAVIGQTYDYEGSLTDLINRDIVRKQEDMDVLSNT